MITLDWSRCLDDCVGPLGLPDRILEDLPPGLLDEAIDGSQAWCDLVRDPVRRAHLDAVETLVDHHRAGCENLLVLGIGGSALGTRALHEALCPATWNMLPADQRGGPRLFVLDNVDPVQVAETLREIRRTDPGLEHTLVNVVSRSGATVETAAQLLVALDMLEGATGSAHAGRIVVTTGGRPSPLRAMAEAAGWTILPIPEGVGGRFSVLSPVGLLPAALCGIDVVALLDGAAAMDDHCRSTDPSLAAVLAILLVEGSRRGLVNHVLMPYASRLAAVGDWWCQLWAESLGKRREQGGTTVHVGPTPIRAIGVTDQHSQLQLYLDGPPDKLVIFVEIADPGEDVVIPEGPGMPCATPLAGSTLGTLLNAEERATEEVLLEAGRPSLRLTLPILDAHRLGQFLMLWQLATACAGTLLGVNPFDQPAVEAIKRATHARMTGRDGGD